MNFGEQGEENIKRLQHLIFLKKLLGREVLHSFADFLWHYETCHWIQLAGLSNKMIICKKIEKQSRCQHVCWSVLPRWYFTSEPKQWPKFHPGETRDCLHLLTLCGRLWPQTTSLMPNLKLRQQRIIINFSHHEEHWIPKHLGHSVIWHSNSYKKKWPNFEQCIRILEKLIDSRRNKGKESTANKCCLEKSAWGIS